MTNKLVRTVRGAGFTNKAEKDLFKGEYLEHLGHLVRVSSDNKNEIGVLLRVDDVYLYLKPCLVSIPLYGTDGESIPNAFIETERPIQIRKFNVDITPLPRDYLSKYVDSINKIKPKSVQIVTEQD